MGSDGDFNLEAETALGPEVDPAAWRDATPLCARCLEPFDPLQHYCAHCGAAVGQFTPYIPFVNIAWTYSFLDIMWRKLWLDRGLSRARRALYCSGVAANIIVLAPAFLLLLAIPFWLRERRKHPPAGFCPCGYDLRGGHPHERCPECGAVTTTSVQPPP